MELEEMPLNGSIVINSDRHQYTEINDTLSIMSYINCGVLQGSILGPLPFPLYINNIIESTKILKFYLLLMTPQYCPLTNLILIVIK